MHTCPNCGNEFELNFCNNCGQQLITGKPTLATVFGDFIKNVFMLEAPIFRTIRDLSVRPGHFVRDYLEGHRKKYNNPFQYFLILLTAYLLIAKLFLGGVPGSELNINATNESGQSVVDPAVIQQFIADNTDTFMIIIVLFYAFTFRLFFGRKNITYPESLIMMYFAIGHLLIFSTIAHALSLFSFVLIITQFLFDIMYLTILTRQFFRQSFIACLIKTIGAYVSSYIIYAIFAGIAGIIYYGIVFGFAAE